MALASVEVHARPETGKQVRAQGRRLREGLRGIQSSHARNVRGAGLMLGLEVTTSEGAPDTELAVGIVQRALRDGILLLADGPASNVLSFTPPFSISDEEIGYLTGRLARYLEG
jgi:4-aminobutyrate aminotransferase-like enzyme